MISLGFVLLVVAVVCINSLGSRRSSSRDWNVADHVGVWSGFAGVCLLVLGVVAHVWRIVL